MPHLMIFGMVALIAVIVVIGYICNKRRREAMAALAARLGLRFNPHRNKGLARQYRFLDKLRKGSNRYAYNILSGNYQGHDVTLFDYHYQVNSGKHTQHYNFSFFILGLPKSFPELVIDKEGFFSKVAQALGYDDIDFESHEFSRKFRVRSPNKKFAYDVCNGRMIEYLLSNSDLSIEIEGEVMAISFNSRLSPEYIEPNLNRLVTVRSLMPEYLFSRS
ncbi:MAG: hypothetical protein ACYSUY_17940 [Planctomycetota bacterium]|jgi:hypothetical protein